MKPDPPPLDLANRLALRPAEAAVVLGVSERTLRKHLSELPHVRLGSGVLIPTDALREWLRERACAEQASADLDARTILAAIKDGIDE